MIAIKISMFSAILLLAGCTSESPRQPGKTDGAPPTLDGSSSSPDGDAPPAKDGATPVSDLSLPPPPTGLSFVLGMGPIAVPISQGGATLDVKQALSQPGWNKKYAALSLAHGMSVFLYLTKLKEGLEQAGGNAQTVSQIVHSFGPNSFIATVMQESFFVGYEHSGYFQIDESPNNMKLNAEGTSDAAFAKYYASFDTLDRKKVIDGIGANFFYTAAVLKGYYDAVTLKVRLSSPETNQLMSFGLNYATNANNSAPITIIGTSYSLDASLGLMRLISYMYNRGPWAAKAIQILKENVSGAKRISEYIPYAEDWGPRYIYQIPAIYTVGQRNALVNKQGYEEVVSVADVEAYLDQLSGLYDTTVINAGKQAAQSAIGADLVPYNSEKFAAAFYQVVGSMLEKTIGN